VEFRDEGVGILLALTAREVIQSTRRTLGLPAGPADSIDDALLGAAIRRLAGFLCPCSPSTLAHSLEKSLVFLVADAEALGEQISEAIEGLVSCGDLLELIDITTSDPTAKGTWLFAAPLSFVVRPTGSAYLFGVSGEEISALPGSLSERIRFERFMRIIDPIEGETLAPILRDLGLREMSLETWMNSPKIETAQNHWDKALTRLAQQPVCSEISDLQLLDRISNRENYRDLWKRPQHQSGTFVARRPQAYGAPLWVLVELKNGLPIRFLDLPQKGSKRRGCDVAWRLQMAKDTCQGNPPTYQCRQVDGGVELDVGFPLPAWAQRRLSIVGRPRLAMRRALFTYWIPESEKAAEGNFLKQHLWFVAYDLDAEGK
jgi:hypothetical protein